MREPVLRDRAQVLRTRSPGWGTALCLVLAVTAGLTLGGRGSHAESESQTYTPPTNVALTPQEFNNDPSSLFTNSNQLGTNVTSLMGNGVSTQALGQALGNGGGASNLNTGQWSSVLGSIQSGNINPSAAATLINGAFGGQVSPQLTQALSSVSNLGNTTSVSSITSLLSNPNITSALSGLTAAGQGQALNQILATALGGNAALAQQLGSGANLSQLTGAVGQAAPALAQLLGQGGVQNGLGSALGAIAGGQIGSLLGGNTGGLAGAVAGAALGGALGGAATAGVGSGLSTGGVSTSSPDTSSCGASGCCTPCAQLIPQHHTQIRTEITNAETRIRNEVTDDFMKHRGWMLTTFWSQHILPALMLMAEQLTTTGMVQVQMIGQFFDAKHQLETQRLFEELTARAHKDYQPSEGMCTFGTNVRSLAPSERRSNLTQLAFAQRMLQRGAMNGAVVSTESTGSDLNSRLQTYIKTYCDQADNANGLSKLCPSAVPQPERRNIDIDYTRNIESKLTLDIDFSPEGIATLTPDEQDVFALSANIFSNKVAPKITPELLGSTDGKIRQAASQRLMDLRSIFAKRSVAQNSFAAMAAMRASGSPESAPYTKAIMRELGVSNDDEINKMLGDKPSYFAQMEVLTKKLYQNPIFYTELYDKPANIERKGAALQAIGLMQDRDLYNSLIRSEAVLSVLLETQLQREQQKVNNDRANITPGGGGGP